MNYKQKKEPLKEGQKTELGKITSATFGIGGYNDAMFGLSLGFSFGEKGAYVCGTFVSGGWAYGVVDPDDKHSKWDEKDRSTQMAVMCKEICQILSDAKAFDVTKLVGKPIEITSNGLNDLESWRILTEVL
jgi:hypothetical protein